jgi:hypothetical protein
LQEMFLVSKCTLSVTACLALSVRVAVCIRLLVVQLAAVVCQGSLGSLRDALQGSLVVTLM